MASLVLRAPSGPAFGLGCCVCRWAAVFLLVVCCPDRSPAAARPARPLAVRAASFARRVGSKLGQALQASRWPPIGRGLSLVCCRPGPAAAHRHRSRALQASRRPPIGRGVCVLSGQALPPTTGTAAGPPPSRRTRIQWSLPTFLSPHPISHAIPPRPFQILKLDRWNCNVF